MEGSFIWITATVVALVILYFLLKKVFSWVGEFLGQSIAFSKKMFIVAGFAVIFFFWQYPNETHVFFQSMWTGLVETYHSIFDGQTLLN